MKNRIKQICTSLLAAMMIFTYMPTMAFAAEGDVQWVDGYEAFSYDGQTYGSDNIKSEVTKAATCSEEGETTYTAYVPDKSSEANKVGEVKVPIEKAPHTPGAAVNENVVEATCEAAGSHDAVVKCTVCNEVISTEHVVDSALGHNYLKDGEDNVVIENENPATCKAAGSHEEVIKCVVCGKDKEGSRQFVDEDVDPNAHVWDAGTVTKEATCGEDGVMTFKCTLDATHAEKTEVIPATGKHNYVEKVEVIKEATFDEEGSATRTVECSVCGDVKEGPETIVIPKKTCEEHKWDAGKVTKEPTDANSCEETGEKTFTCTVCGATKVETFGAKEHQLKTEVFSIPATCSRDGYTFKWTHCLNCDYEVEDAVINEKANGEHDWVIDGPVITEATCLEDGKADADYVYCDDCGRAYKDVYPDAIYYVIKAPGHHDVSGVEPTIENIKAATCTEKGAVDKVLYCKVCGKEASRTTVETAALGHDWDEGVVTTPATCTAEGVKTFTCQHDNTHKRTEAIEMIEHSFGAEVVTPATCVTPGKISKTCSVCHTRVDEEIPAIGIGKEGHTVSDPPATNTVITKEPTCTEEGIKVVQTLCDKGDVIASKTEAIPATGHNWDDGVVKEAAVPCTASDPGKEGIVTKTCTVCGAKEDFPISSHDMEVQTSLSYPATCEADGLTVEKCSRCSLENETVLPKLGHDYERTAAVAHWDVQNPGKGYVEYTLTCKNDATHTKTEQVSFEWTANPENPEEAELPFVYRFIEDDATCTEAGEAYYVYFDEDGFPFENPATEEIPAKGHNYVPEKRNVLDPTCEKAGSYDLVPVCDVCHVEDSAKTQHVEVPALGHDWDEGVVTTEPDYDHDGVMTFTCKNDPTHKDTQVIPATTHTPGAAVIELATQENGGPTCTKPGKGYRTIYCTCCYDKDGNFVHPPVQLSVEEIEVPATGHTPAPAVDFEEDAGYEAVYCLDCEELLDLIPEYVDESQFTPEDAAAVQKAEDAFIKLYNEEMKKDNPDTAALKVAMKALDEAIEAAEENVYKSDVQIWFKDSANMTVTYSGKAVELTASDVTLTQPTTGEISFKFYSDLECTQELASAPLDAGTYYAMATVAADKAYRSKTTATPAKIVIKKAAVKVTPASKTFKIKKAKTLNKTKSFKLTTKGLNKKIGATYKKANKVGGSKIKVSKSGKITVKKGLKKGTYKVKIKSTPTSGNFAAKTITVKIVIKK